jgi:hypothetical protein
LGFGHPPGFHHASAPSVQQIRQSYWRIGLFYLTYSF